MSVTDQAFIESLNLKSGVSFEGRVFGNFNFNYKGQLFQIKAPVDQVLDQLHTLQLVECETPPTSPAFNISPEKPLAMDYVPIPQSLKDTFSSPKPDCGIIIAPMRDQPLASQIQKVITDFPHPVIPVFVYPKGAIIGSLINHKRSRTCFQCLSKRLNNKTTNTEGLDLMTSDDHAQCTALWSEHFWLQIQGLILSELRRLPEAFYFQRWNHGAFVLDFHTPSRHYESVFPVPGCKLCSDTYRNNFSKNLFIFS